MKKLFITTLLLATLYAKSQVLVYPQIPPAGLALKTQLWNLLVVNNASAAKQLHIELRLLQPQNSLPVMSAQTTVFSVQRGNRQLQVNTVSPVQYNIQNPLYTSFAGSQFLPVGNFLACYTFFEHIGDIVSKVAEECMMLEVQPQSPPQLIFPANQSVIETNTPQFSWVSPAPANLFTDLNYDLEIAEIYPNQSAGDAIRTNIPTYRASRLSSLQHLYPLSAPALQAGKNYAWRIVAKNNESTVATTETWQFSLTTPVARNVSANNNDLPFIKLKKEDEAGYAVQIGDLQFDYYNETGDVAWNVSVYDLSDGRKPVSLPIDSVPLVRGSNLVKLDLRDKPGFADQHLYVLVLKNSRNETWRLRFEYRR